MEWEGGRQRWACPLLDCILIVLPPEKPIALSTLMVSCMAFVVAFAHNNALIPEIHPAGKLCGGRRREEVARGQKGDKDEEVSRGGV